MRKLFHSVAVLSVLALCCMGPGSGHAQGYKGLIPDNSEQDANTQENTYGGAVAPSHKNSGVKQEPQGYRGVIPGRVAPQPKPEAEPGETTSTAPTLKERAPRKHLSDTGNDGTRTPRMSMRPGAAAPTKDLTVDDLKEIAAMTGMELRFDQANGNLTKAMHMPAHVYPIVSLPEQRVDGMLPIEVSAKAMIDHTMDQINQAGRISPEARKKAIDDSITNLSNFARGVRIERDMPQDIFDSMGAPPIYVKETREGAGKAADRLQEALRTLQKMQ